MICGARCSGRACRSGLEVCRKCTDSPPPSVTFRLENLHISPVALTALLNAKAHRYVPVSATVAILGESGAMVGSANLTIAYVAPSLTLSTTSAALVSNCDAESSTLTVTIAEGCSQFLLGVRPATPSLERRQERPSVGIRLSVEGAPEYLGSPFPPHRPAWSGAWSMMVTTECGRLHHRRALAEPDR